MLTERDIRGLKGSQMKPILVLAGLLLGGALAAPCLPAVPAVIDLITRNEVQVAASPARVWPFSRSGSPRLYQHRWARPRELPRCASGG
jgi:hypothetical protein